MGSHQNGLPNGPSSSVSQPTVLPARPGFCTLGREIRLLANVFETRIERETVAQHEVVITTADTRLRQNDRGEKEIITFNSSQAKEILQHTLHLDYKDLVPSISEYSVVFDGGHAIWSTGKVFKNNPFKVEHDRFVLGLKTCSLPGPISIRCDLVDAVKRLDFAAVNERDLNKQDTSSLQCLNVVLKERWTNPDSLIKYIPDGPRRFFRTPERSERVIPFDRGMYVIWSGVCGQFVVIGDEPKNATVHLQLDVCNQTFHAEIPALDFLTKAFERQNLVGRFGAFQHRRLNEVERTAAEKAFKGLSVRAVVAGKERTYRVIGLTAPTSEVTFPLKDPEGKPNGQERYVLEFYQTQYNYTIKYPNLPCFHMNTTKAQIYIPMEVCQIVGGQLHRGFIDKQQQADFMKAVAKIAPQRLQAISQMLQRERFNEDPYLRQFGVLIDDQPKKFSGRVLPPPTVKLYKVKKTVKDASYVLPFIDERRMQQGGAANDNDYYYMSPGKIIKWSVISLVDFNEAEKNAIKLFFKKLTLHLQFRGMSIEESPSALKKADNLDKLKEAFGAIIEQKCDLVFLILPDGGIEYEYAKYAADVHYGIASQGVRLSLIKRCTPPVISNIAMQVNSKLLGCAIKLDFERLPRLDNFLREQATMVIGLDVIHPDPGDKMMPSVAAMVASSNNETWTFDTSVVVQNGREEIVMLKAMLLEKLENYIAGHGTEEPRNVVVFRDGVDDGKFKQVLTREMEQMELAFKEYGLAKMPKITVIIVKKRTNMLLFCADAGDQFGNGKNCPPGTIVDRDIVNPNGFDFWIIPHAGIIGTVHPIHCHVVRNDANLCADDLQYLVYALCHIDGRGTRATSIPIPIHYADLVCTRFQTYLKVNGCLEHIGDIARDKKGNARYSEDQLRQLTESGKVHPNLNGTNYFL